MSNRQKRKRERQNRRIAKAIVDEQTELLTGMQLRHTIINDQGLPQTVTIPPVDWVATRVDQLPKELRDKYLQE